MNKFIKTDLENSKKYMELAIMNAIHDIDSGEEKRIELGDYISWPLFRKCLNRSMWIEGMFLNYDGDFESHWKSRTGKTVEIEGSLYDGEYIIEVKDDK